MSAVLITARGPFPECAHGSRFGISEKLLTRLVTKYLQSAPPPPRTSGTHPAIPRRFPCIARPSSDLAPVGVSVHRPRTSCQR